MSGKKIPKIKSVEMRLEKNKSYNAGRRWVANEASLKELVWVFGGGELNIEGGWKINPEDIPEEIKQLSEPGGTWLLNSDTFGSIAFNFIDPEILKNDLDNELFWSFADGAKSMWEELEELLCSVIIMRKFIVLSKRANTGPMLKSS